ncbi:DUF4911 domain-containing protein [Desulfopila aestuarii]|uniref:DUF4911 domain-containing protein n=1 Tax=Desulfopila aestuarii TaxID=231440 RepID=UPI000A059018
MIRHEELFLRISPDKFHFLKFILEGYDNMAILSSFDMARGLVRLRYLSSSRCDLLLLLASIAGKLSSSNQHA